MENKDINTAELLLEILEELRITEEALEVMAEGYCPNKIGAIDVKEDKKYVFRFPVVQLSQKLSEKLMKCDLKWKVF
jgi:hypothetical protein